MQALGRPWWGDIKEHAALPVKPYCMHAHSHAASASVRTTPTLLETQGDQGFFLLTIHMTEEVPSMVANMAKPKSHLPSAWTSCLVTWSLAVSHKELQQISVSFQAKCHWFSGSRFLKVMTCCFSLSFMTINKVLDCWFDKRSHLKTSLWAVGQLS